MLKARRYDRCSPPLRRVAKLQTLRKAATTSDIAFGMAKDGWGERCMNAKTRNVIEISIDIIID